MTSFIFIHVLAGMSGLGSGIFVMAMPNKGNKVHKKAGLFYFTSMMVSTVLSIWLSYEKGKMALLAIGIFTLYMLLAGFLLTPKRFRTFKKSFIPLALLGLVSGIYMISSGLIFLVVFGVLQIVLVVQDCRLVLGKNIQAMDIMGAHAGKMAGSFIAAATAFCVNVIFTGTDWWQWLLPTFAITPLIIVWNIQLRKKRKVKHS